MKKAKKVKAAPKGDNVVTLRELCSQLKVDPVAARVKLRAAVAKGTIEHEAKESWQWAKDSAALSDARKVLE